MAPPKNKDNPQSDLPGVSYVKGSGTWVVQFSRQGRHFCKGFPTQEAAEEAQPGILASLPPKATAGVPVG